MKKLEDTKGVVKKAVNRRTDNTMLKRKRIKAVQLWCELVAVGSRLKSS
jgi:hypothetical protein